MATLATTTTVPKVQQQLLLHAPRQPYQLHHEAEVPAMAFGELLVEVLAMGLNPIDWKSAHYGFALPSLPCLNGREFVGRIVDKNVDPRCGLKTNDVVLAISTDYRDYRKSAFQQYAVVCCFNAMKIPDDVDPYQVASLGVGFIAASMSLGVCLGLEFPSFTSYAPLALLDLARQQEPDEVPNDVREEVFDALSDSEKPKAGDWILMYGASSVSSQLAIQLAKMAGLRVLAVADAAKHKSRLELLGADVVVDRHNLEDAANEIRTHCQGSLRFAVDAIGKETATWCQEVLEANSGSQADSPDAAELQSHLVCLSGAPASISAGIRVHSVPIKLFHTNARLGSRLSKWLARLLAVSAIQLPETRFVEGGLDAVNKSLEMLKNGEVSGQRVVVKMIPGSSVETVRFGNTCT